MPDIRLTPAQTRWLRKMGAHKFVWRKVDPYQIGPDLFELATGRKVHDSTVAGLAHRGMILREHDRRIDTANGAPLELTATARRWLADHPDPEGR